MPFLLKVVIKKFLAQKWLSSTRCNLGKLLWQPLNIDFDMIFRTAIQYFLKIYICTEPLKFSELAQFKVKFSIYIYIYIIFSGGCQKSIKFKCNFNSIAPNYLCSFFIFKGLKTVILITSEEQLKIIPRSPHPILNLE